MTTVGLFSGIGGFELAFSRAGFATRMLVEVDGAARTVLGARFPDAEVREDVADLSALPPETELLLAGFPCQNLSMAGDKAGITGTKSNVVEHLFRLLAHSDVQTVVVENVYFMLQLERGRAMSWIVGEFERLGFRWAYRVLDTMGFGLPQRRRRVYLVASRSLDPAAVLFPDDPVALHDEVEAEAFALDKPIGFYWTEGRYGVGFTRDGVPPLKVGSAVGIPSAPAVLFPDGEVLTPSLSAAERLQGFPSGWTDADFGVGLRPPRWRLVGNAVSVPVAAWVAGRLRHATASEVASPLGRPLLPHGAWPNAAWNLGRGRFGTMAPERLAPMDPPSISGFRDAGWRRLTDRALDGFVGRAEEGGLRMPPGFLQALRDAPREAPRLRSAPARDRGTAAGSTNPERRPTASTPVGTDSAPTRARRSRIAARATGS